jgi:hypothetical protein
MPRALLYYLAPTWTADRHRRAQRGTPARAARQGRRPRRSPRAHRARGLPAVVARRVRTVPGNGSAH